MPEGSSACRAKVEPAALVTRLDLRHPSQGNPGAGQVRWALLADPHLPADPVQSYSGHLPDRNLHLTVPQVVDAAPDAALILGDLAWAEGLPGDYARLKAAIQPLHRQMPVCLMLGNHDRRENFFAEFAPRFLSGPAAPEKSIIVVEHPPVRLILLDSLLRVDLVAGLLGKEQRTWLRQFLENSDDTPTLLFVHHPLDDEDGSLLDGDRLLNLVRPLRQVKAIFHGHDHAYRCGQFEDIHIVSLPAVGMPFDEGQPVGWVEGAFSAQGAELTLHVTVGNRQGEGQTRSLRWRD